MSQVPFALRFVVLVVSGWLTRQQQFSVEYLLEENRVLREQLGSRRLRLTDAQRRRLAVRRKKLERRVLDPLYTAAFRAMLDHCRVNCLRLPLHAVRT